MKRKKILFVIYMASIFAFQQCSKESERQIKLAPRPLGALMEEQVKTVQIAIEEKQKIAVLKFQNQSNVSDADWMSIGLTRMLNSSLVQSRRLVVTPINSINDALLNLGIATKDLENSRASQRLSQSLKAETLISGVYNIKNDSLIITTTLHDGHSGEMMARFSSVARLQDMGSLSSAMNKLAWQIRSELKDQDDRIPEVNRSLADVSTNSLQAYKYYLDGLEKLDQFMMADAGVFFSKAIELDSNFASAHLNLVHTMLSLGDLEESRPILNKAVELAEYVPERERLPILAMDAMINGEPFKAVAIYKRAVELFPEDDEVHYELGNYYFSIAHDYEKAIERYETTIELNPRHKLAYNQLAYSYAGIGEMEHAKYILEKYAELAPDEPNPYDSYAEIAQREGMLEVAVEKYKKALDINPEFWHSRIHLATAYQDLGKFRKAKSLLKKVLKDSLATKQRRQTEGLLALNSIMAGNVQKAEKIWQQLVTQDSTDASAIFSLLTLRPHYEPYREQFARFVESELKLVFENKSSPDYLFAMISVALRCDLAMDKVEKILDMAIRDSHDPIMLQAALAYKLIIDFQKGRESLLTQSSLAKASRPEIFQTGVPISWDDYWRHYFKSLKIANSNNIDIRSFAAGFNEFARVSGNHQFKVNGQLALAAAEFYSGNKATAEEIMHTTGFPNENAWRFVGPFRMTRGFDQKFWPEKKMIDEWESEADLQSAVIAQTDDQYDGYVNLKSIGNTSFNDAMYALLHVDSPSFQDAQVHIGQTGKLKLWLNNEPIMVKNIRSKAFIDQYSANVQLRPGANWMLIRVNNTLGDLGFYFRLTDKNGNGLEQVTYSSPDAFVNSDHRIPNGENEGV